MPATRPTTIAQRQEIMRLLESGLEVGAIAQAVQLATRTVRKWRRQLALHGQAGLAPRRGRPRGGPLANQPGLLRYRVLRLKCQHPGWGAAYVVKKLGEYPEAAVHGLPHPSTIWRYWRQFAPRLGRPRPAATAKPLAAHSVQGVWQLDFKESVLVAGIGATTITHIRDLYGRATVGHCAHTAAHPTQRVIKLTTAQIQADCRQAFRQWGLPEFIRTDRASVFHDDDPSPFPTRLQLWWVGLGITQQLIRRGRPQDNGSVERAHRTCLERTLQGRVFTSPEQLQHQLEADWHELNFECPSRAAGCDGQPPVVAHPELLQPRRVYQPEREAELFDLARVEAYLARGHWLRATSGRGQVSLGGQFYHIGFDWRLRSLGIHFDAGQHAFCFSLLNPDQPTETRWRPARGLSAAELIGLPSQPAP